MRKPIIFVLLAGFAALVAVLVVYSALNRIEPPLPLPYVLSIRIVVAAHDLAIGSKLDQADEMVEEFGSARRLYRPRIRDGAIHED